MLKRFCLAMACSLIRVRSIAFVQSACDATWWRRCSPAMIKAVVLSARTAVQKCSPSFLQLFPAAHAML